MTAGFLFPAVNPRCRNAEHFRFRLEDHTQGF